MAVLARPVGYVSELGGELGCQVCLDFPALFLFEGVRFQEVRLCGTLCPGPDRSVHHLC